MTMKPHRILKGFKGSQNGFDSDEFEAGTVANLSDSLASVAVQAGWAEPIPEPDGIPDSVAEGQIEEIAEIQFDVEPLGEAKAEEPSEENKALSAPENKSRGRKKQP